MVNGQNRVRWLLIECWFLDNIKDQNLTLRVCNKRTLSKTAIRCFRTHEELLEKILFLVIAGLTL